MSKGDKDHKKTNTGTVAHTNAQAPQPDLMDTITIDIRDATEREGGIDPTIDSRKPQAASNTAVKKLSESVESFNRVLEGNGIYDFNSGPATKLDIKTPKALKANGDFSKALTKDFAGVKEQVITIKFKATEDWKNYFSNYNMQIGDTEKTGYHASIDGTSITLKATPENLKKLSEALDKAKHAVMHYVENNMAGGYDGGAKQSEITRVAVQSLTNSLINTKVIPKYDVALTPGHTGRITLNGVEYATPDAFVNNYLLKSKHDEIGKYGAVWLDGEKENLPGLENSKEVLDAAKAAVKKHKVTGGHHVHTSDINPPTHGCPTPVAVKDSSINKKLPKTI